MLSLLRILSLFFVAFFATSCTTTEKKVVAAPEVIQSYERYVREYVLAAGDQLEIVVYKNPDVSRPVFIRPDGYLSLPLLDNVKAAGLSISELDLKLTQLLSQRFRDPEVTVIVANPIEPMVYVYGEVGVVKPVPLRQARTVAQAIAYSAGMTYNAVPKDVSVIRLDDDGYFRTYLFENVGKKSSDIYLSLNNMAVKPDDLIVIPESNRSKTRRFIQDFVTTPLSAANQILSPYFQFRALSEQEKTRRLFEGQINGGSN